MKRFHVPPLPDSPPAPPAGDPLLEKFRADTIKGKKMRGKPGQADDVGDGVGIDGVIPDSGQAGDPPDWGIDDTDSW